MLLSSFFLLELATVRIRTWHWTWSYPSQPSLMKRSNCPWCGAGLGSPETPFLFIFTLVTLPP